MLLVNTLKEDLKKAVLSPAFLLAVLAVLVLSLTAAAWTNYETGKIYSVLEAVIMRNYPNEVCSIFVFQSSFSGYLPMFVSSIAALPVVSIMCGERKSGAVRFIVSRSGKKNYCLSKFICSFICGGLSVVLGRALFGIFIYTAFPPLSQVNIPLEILNLRLLRSSEFLTVAANILSSFLVGAISSLPAFFLCSFCSNLYINICVPCLIYYVLNQIALKTGNIRLLNCLPTELQSIFKLNTASAVSMQLISSVITAALSLAGFAFIFYRRKDIGGKE